MNTEIGRVILKATCAPPQTLTATEAELLAHEVLRQKEIISEVHSWIVCACIATPEDMMQSAQRICEIVSP